MMAAIPWAAFFCFVWVLTKLSLAAIEHTAQASQIVAASQYGFAVAAASPRPRPDVVLQAQYELDFEFCEA